MQDKYIFLDSDNLSTDYRCGQSSILQAIIWKKVIVVKIQTFEACAGRKYFFSQITFHALFWEAESNSPEMPDFFIAAISQMTRSQEPLIFHPI